MLLIVLLAVGTLAMSLYDSAPPGDSYLIKRLLASIIWATLTLAPTLLPGKPPKPYLANMGKRFVSCFAAGHTVRSDHR